ncbi:hypothetical protein HMJ29_13540 [Hymenobacter taeanensis]|uniref:Uncharacterized protein n=1 Tax=Hymenobacter taeanensis TaxID=2735321 RepID=A0A6M6BIT4_9BACT|nr:MULTISPECIES: hypothetical protein [Hymenobacter]QJX47909.1 hypothetical protein HMJ29_13540 [Hymenobacter taeanensis]UOQ82647.1 hypothetical protein MUN83_07780 [Hymenobacter sp. 5414T-23]
MKAFLYISAIGLGLLSASCSQEKILHNPKSSYGSVKMKGAKRGNDKSQFKKNRNPIGLGLDMNGNNPYKFRMVDSGKPYKYSNKPK